MTGKDFHEIAVIVRHTQFDSTDPEHRIALMQAHLDVERAEDEARRLNEVAAGDAVHYFVKIVKFIASDADSRYSGA